VRRQDRGDEPVTAPGDRFDETRCLCRIPERLAQPADGCVQASVEIDERAFGPQPDNQLLARDDLAGFFEQRLKNAKGLLLQLDPNALLPQFPSIHIQLEWAKSKDSLCFGPQHGPDYITP
jgi:hypothetical protein